MKLTDCKQLSLKKVCITGSVIGKFGTFEIEQTFVNNANKVLEVGYTFPMTETATMEVQNINAVVLDKSQSVESREMLSRFENSPRFRFFVYAKDEDEFQKLLDNQIVQMGINIQNDFSRDIKSGRGTNVQIISDGRQTNSAAIAAGYASQIVAGYNADLTDNNGAGINISVRNWFNPNLIYQWYILTVIVAMLALITTLVLTALSIAREREVGTFDQLIVSPLSSFEILLGKSIPPLIISLTLTMIMVGMIELFFHVPFRGSIIVFFFAIAISLLAIVGVGLYFSSISNTQQQAILSAMTFMMPAVLLSGFISPIGDMPIGWQYVTYLNPVRFFIALTRGLFLKGMGIEEVLTNVIPLVIIAALTLTLAGRTFKRKLG
ncbi:MAG: ABC transporter permease [Cyanobacteriota bacterium]|nr:ABC transporter permease [Cyanobacteriota bacterium]